MDHTHDGQAPQITITLLISAHSGVATNSDQNDYQR